MTTFDSNLAAFNSTLLRYMAFTSKSAQEALEKKGRDLGIQLFRGFSERKWGGPGKARKGLAKAELEARTARNVGTTVRPSLLREYFEKRRMILHDRRVAKWGGSTNSYLRSIREAVSLWQTIIGREVAMRQRGIGVLAASFLWFRGRSSQSKGTSYVRNKTGRTMGFAEVTEGSFRIVGETEGLQQVDARYGIVSTALATARADMVTYLRERHAETYRQIFGEMAA